MAGQVMHSWTFIGLVGAFLDLAIAYLLLCASTLAFFASKFLGFFGLCLPCACNGLFGTPNRNYCVQRLLVDYPLESVSSVQLSVKSKFPFSSIWLKDHDYQLNLKLIRDRDTHSVNGFLVMKGEASCSSLLDSNMGGKDLVVKNESVKGIDAGNELVHANKGRFDVKGKGIVNQRPDTRLRGRWEICADCVKVSLVSCLDPSCGDGDSHPSTNHNGNKAIECSSLPVDSGADADHFHDDDETESITQEKASQCIEFREPLHESHSYEKTESSFEEIKKSNVRIQLGYKGNEQNAIRMLEQALEEMHAAYAALFLQLEKERNAAASAADEAMAMVLCLQEEKASVEMEARQYKRIIEEKSSYDVEEMNMLKEILVRRELEKHFLEKEVGSYRQMYNANEQLQDDIPDIAKTRRDDLAASFNMGEDPFLMLRQLSGSIDRKEIVEDESLVNEVSSFDNETCLWDEEDDISKQGGLHKKISHMSYSSRKNKFSENAIYLESEEQEKNSSASEQEEKGSKSPGDMISDMEAHEHDVHFRDGYKDKETLWEGDASNVNRESDLQLGSSEVERICISDFRSANGLGMEPNFSRSCTNTTAGLPFLGGSSRKSNISDLRKNSMTPVEGLKIYPGVEWLKEKFRFVQE